jgi:type I restriction enzyme S subunit
MNENRNIPKMRFPEFTGEWNKGSLKDLVDLGNGRDYKELSEGDIPVYGTGGYMCSVDKALSYDKDAVGIGRKGTIDKPYILRAPFWTVDTLFYAIPKDSQELDFINSLFQRIDWRKKDESSGVPSLSQKSIYSTKVYCPKTTEEKVRIGSFFSKIDSVIALQQQYVDQLKEFKKGFLQKMFPKKGEKVPEMRFPGVYNNKGEWVAFTDDWEQRKIGEISNKVTKKNQDAVVDEVFTNSAEFGIISQRDFFEKDIANAENIDEYYVVEPDDFVYNPRISTTAPYGPIKRNKLERTGAMSPLYYVFRPYDIDLSYLEWYFQTTCWHAFMRFNGNSGARSDRFAITDKIFNEMPISMPQDIEEQKLIGTFLTKLESLITLHQRKLDEMKEFKKGCLQKMFV